MSGYLRNRSNNLLELRIRHGKEFDHIHRSHPAGNTVAAEKQAFAPLQCILPSTKAQGVITEKVPAKYKCIQKLYIRSMYIFGFIGEFVISD